MLQQFIVPIAVLYAAFSIREVFIMKPGGVGRTITSILQPLVALMLVVAFWLSWNHTASGNAAFLQLVVFVSFCAAFVMTLAALIRRIVHLRHNYHYGK